jgi:hypothetical protein
MSPSEKFFAVLPWRTHTHSWLATRRKEYHNGSLHPEKAQALDDTLGPSWKDYARFLMSFEDALAELTQWMAANDGIIPQQRGARTPSGFNIGKWVNNKRGTYAQGKLPEEQVMALEGVPGWTWLGKTPMVPFHEGVRLLEEFVRVNGRLPTAREEGPNPGVVKLGRWVVTKRREGRAGKLSQEQKAALEGIPVWEWHATAQTIR